LLAADVVDSAVAFASGANRAAPQSRSESGAQLWLFGRTIHLSSGKSILVEF
jgi:hypothetical protein